MHVLWQITLHLIPSRNRFHIRQLFHRLYFLLIQSNGRTNLQIHKVGFPIVLVCQLVHIGSRCLNTGKKSAAQGNNRRNRCELSERMPHGTAQFFS